MRHKTEIPETKYHRLMDHLCITLYIVVALSILFYRDKLPDVVPIHYGTGGAVDAYGPKFFILFCPVLSFFLYLFLRFAERYPDLWNIPISITRKNSDHVYLMTKNMLVTIRFIVVTIFSYISIQIIRNKPLGWWFFPVTLTILFGVIFLYIVRIRKTQE